MAADRTRAFDDPDELAAVRHRPPQERDEAPPPSPQPDPPLPSPASLADSSPAGRGQRPGRVAAVQRLQQIHGNRAVQRLIRTDPVPAGAPPTEEEDLSARLRASGTGSAIPEPVQRRLESGLGADLSGVRVHTDSEADHLSRAVDATAFTAGSDIYFRAGTYDPASVEGMRLLAHEAAHTVQQAAGPVAGQPGPGGLMVSDPGDTFEQAAERSAGQVTDPTAAMAGTSNPANRSPAAAWGAIQRATEDEGAGSETATDAGPEVAPDPRVEAAVEQIVRSVTADPEDRTGGARQLLDQVDPGIRQAVISTVRSRLTPDQWARLAQGGAAPAPEAPEVAGAEASAGGAPAGGVQAAPQQAAPAAIQRDVERKLPTWGTNTNGASYMKFNTINAALSGFDESGAEIATEFAIFSNSPERQPFKLPAGVTRGFVKFRLMASWFEDNLLLDDLGHGLFDVNVPFSVTEGTLQWQTPIPGEQTTNGSGAVLQLPVPVATGLAQRGGWVTITPAIVGTASTSLGGSIGIGPISASTPTSDTANRTTTFTGSFTVSVQAPPLPEPVPLSPHLTFRVNKHDLIEGEEGRLSTWFRSQPPEVQSALRSGQRPLQISGYASTTNSMSYNRALAQRRANYVQDILRGFVGSQATISIFYFGEDAARTADRVEAAEERRCEVVIGASRAGAPPPTGAQ